MTAALAAFAHAVFVAAVAAAAGTFAASFDTCVSPCAVLASVSIPSSSHHVPAATVEKLRGKWEAYELGADDTAGRQRLIVAGSDPRGTIFGLYAFIEQRLGVDPLYFWTGREPAPRAVLSWPAASLVISAGETALTAGRAALRAMRESQRLAARGRLADWYRGDKKMRLSRARETTDRLLASFDGGPR
jgi:hypothetical protein